VSATIDHPQFRVVDDFLGEDAWSELWTHFQFVELLPVTRSLGAWKLDDGVPLGGHELVIERSGPGNGETPLHHLITTLLGQPDLYEGLVRDTWTHVSARPYVYPRDTGLSWHIDDHELYAGAFIYYAHPRWDAHWGGELLIAELPADADEPDDELPIMGYRFETQAYSERLLDMGCGNFVMPKPNRLVLLAGAPHMIARVSPAAGHNVRASVSGFFLKPTSK
jgi:hypothetical protein